jgi:sirohydrochlorin cobaltochelatase
VYLPILLLNSAMTNPMPPPPLIIVAFGTSTKARASYDLLESRIRKRFPAHDLFWAWSSRILNTTSDREKQPYPDNLPDTLRSLHQQQHPWAVVQSLHLLGGHEFMRMVAETIPQPIRTSIGLPLLTTPQDYQELCAALAPLISSRPDQAILVIGHGTDHPLWCAYPALQYFLRHRFGPRIFVGIIENGYPESSAVIAEMTEAGYTRACIIPLLLVAGMHFQRDLAGNHHNSWASLLARAHISVDHIEHGLGAIPAISDLFCRHIAEALAVIPDNVTNLSPQEV